MLRSNAGGRSDRTVNARKTTAPAPVRRHSIGEELLLFASYHAARAAEGIEQHAGDNHKSPPFVTRPAQRAKNVRPSIVPNPPGRQLAKTDHHKGSVAPMTVPAILCDAPAKTKKVQAHTDRFATSEVRSEPRRLPWPR